MVERSIAFLDVGRVQEAVVLDQPRSFRWIDAICINQGDEQEKSNHIVRMRDIYASADRVCAWLGENSQQEDIIIRRAIDITNSIRLNAKDRALNEKLLRGSTNDLESFVDGLFKLTAKSWFSRVWVIQEVALATRKPIILAGEAWTEIKALVAVVHALSRFIRGFARSDTALLAILAGIRKDYFKDATIEADSNINTTTVAARLDKVVGKTNGYFDATLPHDYLYGLLGLVSSGELSDPLLPDYNKPFGQVYQEYAKLIIEHTGNLSVLFWYRSNLRGSPSWVPEFSSNSSRAWDKPVANVTSSISFSQSGHQITLRGLEIDICSHVYTAPSRSLDDLQANCLAWLQQLDLFLDKISEITHSTKNETLGRWLQFSDKPDFISITF